MTIREARGFPLVSVQCNCSGACTRLPCDCVSLQLQPDAVLILYNFSGQCSGEALITFPSEDVAKQAVAERSSHSFYGQQVHLVFCN